MKLMKAMVLLVVVGAVAALAVTLARPAYGQGRDTGQRQQFLLTEGAGSQIGVTARDLDAAESERLKVPGGVYIETVRSDSPAARAGLQASDVVVEFDGERVRSLRQFTRLVRETPPDREVRATVLRDGSRRDLTVTPTAAGYGDWMIDGDRIRERVEDSLARIRPFEFDFEMRDLTSRSRLGATVQELTPELAAYFGAKDGVLVASVVAESPAARAGLQAGDVIIAVNGRDVTANSDLVRELRDRTQDEITLRIVRDKKESTVTATLETPGRRRPARSARPVRLSSI